MKNIVTQDFLLNFLLFFQLLITLKLIYWVFNYWLWHLVILYYFVFLLSCERVLAANDQLPRFRVPTPGTPDLSGKIHEKSWSLSSVVMYSWCLKSCNSSLKSCYSVTKLPLKQTDVTKSWRDLLIADVAADMVCHVSFLSLQFFF